MADVIKDECRFFPKNAWKDLDEFASRWSSTLWRIQEAARRIGLDKCNYERMDAQRCAITALATKLKNGTIEGNKSVCPVRCVERETQCKTVSVRIPPEDK